jgi:glutamine amidotransferase
MFGMDRSKNSLIAVVDYGLGNLRSVSKALGLAGGSGASVKVSSDPKEIRSAAGVVLPGVGAFYRGMENLEKADLIYTLRKVIEDKKPFLGICLGLQLLFSSSEEHGTTEGLGIIKGTVKKFQGDVKIPHMGWNQVKSQVTSHKPQDLFKGIPDNSYFYFVHSYFVEPENKSLIYGTTEYAGMFTSAIKKDNIYAVQFHPEKSGKVGLQVLKNFVEIVNE